MSSGADEDRDGRTERDNKGVRRDVENDLSQSLELKIHS